jgi:hypothetical protein
MKLTRSEDERLLVTPLRHTLVGISSVHSPRNSRP